MYEGAANGSGLDLRIVHTAVDAVHATVEDPGRAVLVDMATTLHAGVSETARLYELGIAMPILRCTQTEDGEWTAMCQAPFKRRPLKLALYEIAHNEPSWIHPKLHRHFVRVPAQFRVLFRKSGESTWLRGNSLNASIGGIYLLSLQTVPVGTAVELELLDIGSSKIEDVRATIVWVASWEGGPRLPGMGIEFDQATIPADFRRRLADLYTRREA